MHFIAVDMYTYLFQDMSTLCVLLVVLIDRKRTVRILYSPLY